MFKKYKFLIPQVKEYLKENLQNSLKFIEDIEFGRDMVKEQI